MPISKRTPERVQKILESLRHGIGREGAAKMAGIGYVTLRDWMDADPDLREKVESAEAEFEHNQIFKTMIEDYTEERVGKIERALKSGNTRWTACRASGISMTVFRSWMDIYPEFATKVHDCEAFAESVNVNNVLKAATNGSWQASAWWLERRVPEHWGRLDRVDLVVRKDQAEQAARELRAEGIYVTADELLKESDEIATKALPVPGAAKSKKS